MANSDILKLSNDGKTVIGVNDMSVKSITIPDGVTGIGDGAFACCSSLQSINVSKDNKHFASVDGILFNKDLTAIVRFPQKNDVKEYVIPTSVTEIRNSAFSGCSSLQSIDIPDSVTEIGDSAFSDCSSLQSIDIPDSVTKIGDGAFKNCSSLQSIDIPNSVTVIGNNAFKCCSSLQSIDVSNDNMHFASVDGILFNKDLTAIVRFPPKYDVNEYVIPNSVTVIGYGTFEGCSSLQRIDIPNCVTEIGDSAFWDCSFLQSITIPDGITIIGNEVFMGCKSLQRIDIPDSVTKIGDRAFSHCRSLQNIDVSKDNKHFASVDGILFNKDLTAIVRFPPKYEVKEYIIPNSVTKIMWHAFHGCSSLQSIDIPNSVTEIGPWAFHGCNSLEHIYLHCNDVEKLEVDAVIFYGVNFDKCILHIPSGTRWAYRHHDVFKRFKNIVTTGF